MRYKRYGVWQRYTWKDYYLNVKYLALGLLSLGFEPGDKVLIIGDNAPQWYYAELAAQANHGVSVGVYSDSTPLEIKYFTHRTMMAGAEHHLHLDPWHENDNAVPYLPPVWMTEQWLAIGCHLLSANILNFAEGPETQQQDAREIGPNILFHGARLWEDQAAMIQARILGADAIKRSAFHLFMPIGYKIADFRFQKKKPNLLWKTLYVLADIALFRSIKDKLGLSKARICYATGAILSPDVLRFYHALDVPLKSLYGTTEGGALTGARNDDIRLETVGPVHQEAKVRVTDQGELVYRQPGIFLGYYKDSDKTAEVLKDGWFHSGDHGFINEDGHLVVLGRVKDLVELANGDELAPQLIESRLRFSPYIKDAWVVAGPDGAYVSAIIIIDQDSVSRWAGQRGVAYTTFAELSQGPEVYELVKRDSKRLGARHFHRLLGSYGASKPGGCLIRQLFASAWHLE